MREISRCPRERPFWCSHPHCLSCNWDDNRQQAASALAAFVHATVGLATSDLMLLPPTSLREARRWVAWLCAECLGEPATVRWFYRTVRRQFPHAVVVARPGTDAETCVRPSHARR